MLLTKRQDAATRLYTKVITSIHTVSVASGVVGGREVCSLLLRACEAQAKKAGTERGYWNLLRDIARQGLRDEKHDVYLAVRALSQKYSKRVMRAVWQRPLGVTLEGYDGQGELTQEGAKGYFMALEGLARG